VEYKVEGFVIKGKGLGHIALYQGNPVAFSFGNLFFLQKLFLRNIHDRANSS
jgi:hypothetical protein